MNKNKNQENLNKYLEEKANICNFPNIHCGNIKKALVTN